VLTVPSGLVIVLGAVVLVPAVAATATAPRTRPSTSSDWTVYHQDLLGSGVDPSGTTLTEAGPAWTSTALDGELYGEPLEEAGLVIAATENDTVYALDATTGAVVWQTHIAAPVPSVDLPCGDISPTVGITSTPVIDPTIVDPDGVGEVFVVADESIDGNGASHHLLGLDLSTGDIVLDQTVDPPGSFPLYQLQRPALTLDQGQVIIAYGGNAGDCESPSAVYHGWVVAVPETGGSLSSFEVADQPGDSQGAIWLGGAAPIVDGSGNIWVATGNSAYESSSDPYDDSDGVLELSPTLALEQSFAPSDWYADNAADRDLSSMTPALLGNGLIFQAGKSQTGYLLSQSALGGVGGQLALASNYCGANVDGGVAVSGDTVYTPCLGGVVATQISSSPPSINVLWKTTTGAGGPPIIAGGLVWTIDLFNGLLYGLNPSTGHAVQWFPLGTIATHFPTPTVADGELLAASADQIHAFVTDPLAVTTTTVRNGSVFVPYSARLASTGGFAPYLWSVASGHLPAGLTLSSTGTISGTPQASGTSNFTVKVVDENGTTHAPETATQALSITVTQPTPTISRVNPNSGPDTHATMVQITGTALEGATSVYFGATPAHSFTVNSTGTMITTYAPPQSAAPVFVTVTTPGGTSADTVASRFTYLGPTITRVSPSSGPGAGGTLVTVTGLYLNGVTGVAFGTTPATRYSVNAAGTSLSVYSPSQSAGLTDIRITTPGGTSLVSATDRFTYLGPTITRVYPASGPGAGNTEVTISGMNLNGVSSVLFGTNGASRYVVNDAGTAITAFSPPGTAGLVNIRVTTPGGTSAVSTADRFSYLAPSLTRVSPSGGPTVGGTTVTVSGTNLNGASAVLFGPMSVAPASVNAAGTSLTVISPAGSAGTVYVRVTTPGGTSPVTMAARFTYP
jgi:hypothetical protein